MALIFCLEIESLSVDSWCNSQRWRLMLLSNVNIFQILVLYWLPEFNIGVGQHFFLLSWIGSGKFYLICRCYWTDASCSKLHKMLCCFIVGSIIILHQHWCQICISLQPTSRIEVLVSVLALVPCNIGRTLSNSIHDIFLFWLYVLTFPVLFLLHL